MLSDMRDESYNEPLVFLTSPHGDRKDKMCHEATFWNYSCRSDAGEPPKAHCRHPTAAEDFKSGSKGKHWELRVDMNATDFAKMAPMTIMSMLVDAGRRNLEVTEVHQNESLATEEDIPPGDDMARCGEPPPTNVTPGPTVYSLVSALLTSAYPPCIRTVSHSGCKCNGAHTRADGRKLAWCYVKNCSVCGERGKTACTKGLRIALRRCWTCC